MGVLDSPWDDQDQRMTLRDAVKIMWSRRFRKQCAARRARDAETRALRLDAGTREFVREVFNEALAVQHERRLKPDAFAHAVREHLTAALEHAQHEVDLAIAVRLLELALAECSDWIANATFGKDTPQPAGKSPKVTRYEFPILVSDGASHGNVTYTVCATCQQGVLDNITVNIDIEHAGIGRRALDELQHRWPDVRFNTTGQRSTAQGFYDRYRTTSPSPWQPRRNGCPHLADHYGVRQPS